MIGDQIKKLRKEKGLTQQAFADLLGTSSGYISEIEKGKKTPGGEFFFSLRRVFNIDLNQFIADEVNEKQAVYQVAKGDGIIQVGGRVTGNVVGGNKLRNNSTSYGGSEQNSGIVPIDFIKLEKVLKVLEEYVAPRFLEEIKKKLIS